MCKTFTSVAVLLSVVFCLSTTIPQAFAQTVASRSESENMSLLTLRHSTVMQGENLHLSLSFPKLSTAKTIQLTDDLAWAEFALLTHDGKVVSSWKPAPRVRVGMYSLPTWIAHLPTQKTYIAILPTELTDVPTGKYNLVVHAHFPVQPSTEALRVTSASNLQATVTQTFNVSVEITGSNRQLMRDKVKRLYHDILNQKDQSAQDTLMKEIAVMSPSVAQATWKTILQSRQFNSYKFASILSEVISKPVVDTLVYVQFTNPIRDADGNIQNLVNLLEGMRYSTTDIEIQRYIDEQILKHKNSIFNAPTHGS